MPDSTHYSHGVEINLEMVAAGSEEVSVNDLTEDQLRDFQESVLKRLGSMSPKEFFRDACNVFDSQPDPASGWMIATLNEAGDVRVRSDASTFFVSVSDALKYKNKSVFKGDAHKDVELPDECFWLSVEEAMGDTPVFLVGTGDLGPLVNIGTYLKMADRWDVDEIFEEPGMFAENVLDALKQAGNPSHDNVCNRVYEDGFQFNTAELKAFMERHRPDLVENIDWPASPAP